MYYTIDELHVPLKAGLHAHNGFDLHSAWMAQTIQHRLLIMSVLG